MSFCRTFVLCNLPLFQLWGSFLFYFWNTDGNLVTISGLPCKKHHDMVAVYISWNPDCRSVSGTKSYSWRRVYILHLTTSYRRRMWPSCPAAQSFSTSAPQRGLLPVLLASPDTMQLGQKLSWEQASKKKNLCSSDIKILSRPAPALLMHLSCSCFPWFWPEPCWRCASAWPTSWPPDLTSDFSGLL